MKNINNFLLTSDVTVGQLKNWMSKKDEISKEKIVKLIYHRFYNRYVKDIKEIKSGFLKMAVSCLTIETIESFKQGRKNTKGIGPKMFKDYFESEERFFPGFKNIHTEFYIDVRCGILHQAETTNAWRILRAGNLLDETNKSINSTKFVLAVEKSLANYITELKSADLNSKLWTNVFIKLDDICENCKARL